MPATYLTDGRGPVAICLAAALLALCLSGCGRRGPLEPPTDPAAAAQPTKPAARATSSRTGNQPAATTLATQQAGVVEDTPDDETTPPEGEDVLASVNPSPTPRRRLRAYTVPKDSFILDPLL